MTLGNSFACAIHFSTSVAEGVFLVRFLASFNPISPKAESAFSRIIHNVFVFSGKIAPKPLPILLYVKKHKM
jgi:hypothetical protein